MKREIKLAAIRGAAFWFLALACIIGAGEVQGIWHDALLVTGGVFLGAVGAFVVVILYLGEKQKEGNAERASKSQ